MIKRPFLGLTKPELRYPVATINEKEPVTQISLPDRVTLLHEITDNSEAVSLFKDGDKVATGQKININGAENDYIISPVTGTISDVSEFTGYLGKSYLSIAIATEEDRQDEEFKEHSETVTAETAQHFLENIPGDPDLQCLCNNEKPLDTIVITGVDKDLLVSTSRFIMKAEGEALKTGIEYLKKINKSARIIIVVTPDLVQYVEGIDAEVKEIQPIYPEAFPELLIQKILGRVVPAGESCGDIGIGFVNAEAVAAFGNAFGKGVIPVDKVLTIIDKEQKSVIVRARIGTSVKDIFDALHINTDDGDRVVMGGPMTGISIFTLDMPVMKDTDAIIIQDKDHITAPSGDPCINCGECVRVCPASVPVNMLVRLLENDLYEEAVDQYDLKSCIECGLCAYVCMARIPVFHYIMLGKYEFDKIKGAEESNA